MDSKKPMGEAPKPEASKDIVSGEINADNSGQNQQANRDNQGPPVADEWLVAKPTEKQDSDVIPPRPTEANMMVKTCFFVIFI
jgi:hypothetical protein